MKEAENTNKKNHSKHTHTTDSRATFVWLLTFISYKNTIQTVVYVMYFKVGNVQNKLRLNCCYANGHS